MTTTRGIHATVSHPRRNGHNGHEATTPLAEIVELGSYSDGLSVKSRELDVAIAAAYEAGAVVRTRFEKPALAQLKRESAGDALDYVSDVDYAVETTVMRRLKEAFPHYGFLSEERGLVGGRSEARWIIDPIDGTLNFLSGLPFFTISIALERNGEIALGVVYNPITGDMYHAEVGGGAFRNEVPIGVSRRASLSDALLGCTIDKRPQQRAEVLRQLDRLGSGFKSLICLQASSLALCLLADGKLDALLDFGCYWDFAAAHVIASEAGAAISDWAGEPFGESSGYLLAANPALHRQLQSQVAAS